MNLIQYLYKPRHHVSVIIRSHHQEVISEMYAWSSSLTMLNILTKCCLCLYSLKMATFFYVLLTVHLSIYISHYLTNLMHKICFTVSFISCLYMFRAHVLIIRRSKLHYTASGIITHAGGRLVHENATYRCDVVF